MTCPRCGHPLAQHYALGCLVCVCTLSAAEITAAGQREGEARRDRGIARVQAAEADDGWKDAAIRWVLDLEAGSTFTSTDVTNAVGEPARRNMVGALIHSLASSKPPQIVKTGTYRKSARPTRNAAIIAEWRRL